MYARPRTPTGLPLLLAALLCAPAWGLAAPDRPSLVEESGTGFTIKAAVPVFAPAGAAQEAGAASANAQVRALVEGLIESFRGERRQLAAQGSIPGADWSLLIEHEPPLRTAHYLAVLVTGYDFRGGAHGVPIIEPLVFALPDGRRIPPAGLFRPDTDWLGQLAARCYAELKLRDLTGTDDAWLRAGTQPKAENYRLLLPGPAGLRVIFPPAAVAASVAGTQEVLIPYRDLAGVLEPTLFGEQVQQ